MTKKSEVVSTLLFCGSSMYPGNYLNRPRDVCGLAAANVASSDETVVIKGSLDIARWAESDCTCGSESHSVISDLVSLDVFAKS